MNIQVEKSHNQKNIFSAVTYLIEECIRNGMHDQANILRKALSDMKNVHEPVCDQDYDAIYTVLSKVILMEKEQLEEFIEFIEKTEH